MEFSFSSFLFLNFSFLFLLASFFFSEPPLSVVAATTTVVNATACSCITNNSTRHNHTWIGPIGHLRITVDINGTGDFRSVQDAVDAVPVNNTKNVLIQISPGHYM